MVCNFFLSKKSVPVVVNFPSLFFVQTLMMILASGLQKDIEQISGHRVVMMTLMVEPQVLRAGHKEM